MPFHFDSLEDAASAFVQSRQDENDECFKQSDIAQEACTEENRAKWGQTEDDILAHIGKQSRSSRTTMYARLLVGRVFPPHRRNDALYWSHHEVCARTYRADDPDAPYRWLDYAADNELSVHKLKAAIKLHDQSSDPSPSIPPLDAPVFLLDNELCTVDYFDGQQIHLYLLTPKLTLTEHQRQLIGTETRVVVTVVCEPAPPLMPPETDLTSARECEV